MALDRENWAGMTAHTTFPLAAGSDTFFKLAFAFGVVVAGLEIGYLLYSPLPYDPVGYLVGRDFVNTWVGGELALTRNPQAIGILLAAEFVIHYHMDWLKVRTDMRFGLTDQMHVYWIVFGIDQVVHQLTYIGMIYAVLKYF